ncbi:hypothetical protein ACFL0T_04635 [Candidatus Omnitrophota bacterium]
MKLFKLFLVCLMGLSLISIGCGGSSKTESSKAAIDYAKTLETVQAKSDFLVKEAKAFYKSEKFQDAVDTVQYVLRYLDKDSTDAKALLEQAKKELVAKAQSAFDQAKKGF